MCQTCQALLASSDHENETAKVLHIMSPQYKYPYKCEARHIVTSIHNVALCATYSARKSGT
jgi:hypothetical protein